MVKLKLMVQKLKELFQELHQKQHKHLNLKIISVVLFSQKLNYAGLTLGLDVVPFKIKLGDGKRTDTTSDANESTQEDGTVTAEANLDYLTTIYAHYPIGDWYAGLGYHMTKVSTDEKLHTSSYGDENYKRFQYGIGLNSGNLRYELSYSDFDDISLTSV